jgi:hypothetical protein
MVPSPDPAQLTPSDFSAGTEPLGQGKRVPDEIPPSALDSHLHSPKSIRTVSRNAGPSSRHQPALALMSTETLVILSGSCAVRGFLSIIASIYIWLRAQFPLQEATPDAVISIAVAARAERSAIFVGLWAPSFSRWPPSCAQSPTARPHQSHFSEEILLAQRAPRSEPRSRSQGPCPRCGLGGLGSVPCARHLVTLGVKPTG